MRQTTEKVVNAFLNGKYLKVGNSYTDGQSFYLHNNKIAEHRSDGLYISNAGWFSNTTKERLNGIPAVNISQKKYKWYLNGEEWDGNWIRINQNEPPIVDQDKSKKKFNTSLGSERLDGWRNYDFPVYAVVGANDTGLWSDSPCPSDVNARELEAIQSKLKKAKIPTKFMTLESSNVFMVRRFIIVPPYYVDNAREIVSQYLNDNHTRLLYIVE
jgi:hypothetical protein